MRYRLFFSFFLYIFFFSPVTFFFLSDVRKSAAYADVRRDSVDQTGKVFGTQASAAKAAKPLKARNETADTFSHACNSGIRRLASDSRKFRF